MIPGRRIAGETEQEIFALIGGSLGARVCVPVLSSDCYQACLGRSHTSVCANEK